MIICSNSADLYLQALIHNNLGAALTELNQLQEAETRLRLAITCWEQLDDHYMFGISLGGIAQIKARSGQIDQANNFYNQALATLTKLAFKPNCRKTDASVGNRTLARIGS